MPLIPLLVQGLLLRVCLLNSSKLIREKLYDIVLSQWPVSTYHFTVNSRKKDKLSTNSLHSYPLVSNVIVINVWHNYYRCYKLYHYTLDISPIFQSAFRYRFIFRNKWKAWFIVQNLYWCSTTEPCSWVKMIILRLVARTWKRKVAKTIWPILYAMHIGTACPPIFNWIQGKFIGQE